MVPPPAKNWEPELKMSERFLPRFYFVSSLFVWELLSPRWTATRSTFRLTMGSTATQSTGGKKNQLEIFLRPYGFGSWGVGSVGFGNKMMVSNRPNSLYGGYT